MRAHRFRPFFDKLDGRIVLSDVSVVPVDALAVTVVVVDSSDPSSTGMMPGEEIDTAGTWNWVLAGAPPAPTYDLSSPPVDPTSGTTTASN